MLGVCVCVYVPGSAFTYVKWVYHQQLNITSNIIVIIIASNMSVYICILFLPFVQNVGTDAPSHLNTFRIEATNEWTEMYTVYPVLYIYGARQRQVAAILKKKIIHMK